MNFKEMGKMFAAEMWPLLEKKLDRLEVEGQEMRWRAKVLLELQTESFLLRMSGKDPLLVEEAVKSSAQSLKAAGSIIAVQAIREMFTEGARTATSVLLSIL